MKRVLLAIVLSLAATAGRAEPVQDDRSEKVVGLARVVCAQAGIVLHCRKLYTLDDKLSAGLERTARQTLDQALGARQAAAAIEEQSSRVARLIGDIGEDQWSADQRDILNADGVKVFVD